MKPKQKNENTQINNNKNRDMNVITDRGLGYRAQ
nr:MAG TPA: hypothetical protein [Bacteriophage sp.]